MSESAWNTIAGNLIHDRTDKPRSTGLTMVIDTGVGFRTLADILELSGHYIDHWKLGFGTSAFQNLKSLQKKLAILAEANILTYPGGTLLEVALIEHHCRDYMKQAKNLGFTAIEVSDGSIPMPAIRRKNIIQCARDADLQVIAEVGKKDPRQQPSAEKITELALLDLENGADWIVMEGRESGKAVGIYGQHGQIIESALNTIIDSMASSANRLIWEAPLKDQQAYLINRLGTNVNLGNVLPDQLLAVEALRCRLRFDTLYSFTDQLLRQGEWDPQEIEPHHHEKP